MPGPRDSEATFERLRRAGALLAAGRPADAAEELRRGLADSPDDPDLLALLAFCQLRLGEPEPALATAEACVREAPDRAEGHRLLGLALLDLRRRRPALAALETAERLDPENHLVLHALAACLLALKRKKRAEEVIERLARIAPDWAETHDLRAALAASRRRWSQVEHDSRTVLAIDAQHVDGLFRLAIAQGARGDHREAIETMHAALRQAPDNAQVRKQLLRLIDTRFRNPPMRYLMAVPLFQPLLAVAGFHLLWLRLTTHKMLVEHTPPVQEVIRQYLHARDAGGFLRVLAIVLAFPTLFWTLVTVFAPEDLATPISLGIQAGIWLVVGLLSWRVWVVKKRYRAWRL